MEKFESSLISLFRIFFLSAAWLVLIGALIFYAFMAFQYLTAAPEPINPPSINTEYTAPEESPVEVIVRLQKQEEAQDSFAKEMTSAQESIRLAERASRAELREIDSRYFEFMQAPDAKSDATQLTDLISRKHVEVEASCSNTNKAIDFIIEGLTKTQTRMARTFDVTTDSFSANPASKLRASVTLSGYCKKYSPRVTAIADNLRGAFPINWGLSGENTKADLASEIDDIFSYVVSQIEDEQFATSVLVGLEQFSNQLGIYYAEQRKLLEDRRMFDFSAARTIGEAIGADVRGYLSNAIRQYNRYRNLVESEADSAAEKKARVVVAVTSSFMVGAVLLSLLALLVFLAMERHQRSIRSIAEAVSGDLKTGD